MRVPPPPPLHNQPSTNTFQYDDADNELGDAGDLPLLRAPSGRSQESLNPMPGQYHPVPSEDDVNNIRYGRIPQRVPRRNKTIKRVECVFLLNRRTSPHSHTAGCSMGISCSTRQCLRNYLTSAHSKRSASSHICVIRPLRATRMTLRTMGSRCGKCTMTRPAGRSSSSS